MKTVLTNAYICLDQKSKLLETNSVAIATKELLQNKIYAKNIIFYKMLKLANYMEIIRYEN